MVAAEDERDRAAIEDRLDGRGRGGAVPGVGAGRHRHVATVDDAHLAAGEDVGAEVLVVVGEVGGPADRLGADGAGGGAGGGVEPSMSYG